MQVVRLYPEQNTMVIAAVNDGPHALSVFGTGSYHLGEFVWFRGEAERPELVRAYTENDGPRG